MLLDALSDMPVSRWMPPFLVSVAALLAGACSPCPSTHTALVSPDGGPVSCVTAEDCPRTGNETVCTTNPPENLTTTCLSCVSTACLRVVVTCP